jgi:hypothetical protein
VRPTPICADCIYHKETSVRGWLGGTKLVHKCYIDYDARHPITGANLNTICDCKHINSTRWCHFENKESVKPVKP